MGINADPSKYDVFWTIIGSTSLYFEIYHNDPYTQKSGWDQIRGKCSLAAALHFIAEKTRELSENKKFRIDSVNVLTRFENK